MNVIEFRHEESARAWALSEDRIDVFAVSRPNPEHAAWLERKAAHEASQSVPVPGTDNVKPFDEPEPPAEVKETYTMPAKPNPGLALAYLKEARVNTDLAASWLLEHALGSEGYDALAAELAAEPDPDVAQATMQTIIKFVAQRAMGGLSGKA